MPPGLELRRALSNLSLKALSLGLERGCRLLGQVAAAPVLGQAAFGRFAFASTVTTFLALGTDLGHGLWTTRALARGRRAASEVLRLGVSVRVAGDAAYGAGGGRGGDARRRSREQVAVSLLGIAAWSTRSADHRRRHPARVRSVSSMRPGSTARAPSRPPRPGSGPSTSAARSRDSARAWRPPPRRPASTGSS